MPACQVCSRAVGLGKRNGGELLQLFVSGGFLHLSGVSGVRNWWLLAYQRGARVVSISKRLKVHELS